MSEEEKKMPKIQPAYTAKELADKFARISWLKEKSAVIKDIERLEQAGDDEVKAAFETNKSDFNSVLQALSIGDIKNEAQGIIQKYLQLNNIKIDDYNWAVWEGSKILLQHKTDPGKNVYIFIE